MKFYYKGKAPKVTKIVTLGALLCLTVVCNEWEMTNAYGTSTTFSISFSICSVVTFSASAS